MHSRARESRAPAQRRCGAVELAGLGEPGGACGLVQSGGRKREKPWEG